MLIAKVPWRSQKHVFLRLIDRCFTSEVCTLSCLSSDLHMQERERELFTVSSSEALSFYLRRRRWELKRQQRVL